jgi:hypothetical protein
MQAGSVIVLCEPQVKPTLARRKRLDAYIEWVWLF